MGKVFTLVGIRGFNANDSGYNESSLNRGYGRMNHFVAELVQRNELALQSVSYSAVLLPYNLSRGAAGADVHIAATVVYEGEITDPVGAPVSYRGETLLVAEVAL
jgi:hypothetical protein